MLIDPPDLLQVPRLFHDILAHSTIPHNKTFSWWRAQGTAYLMRPNARLLREVEKLKAEKLVSNTAVPRPADVPPDCIGVYVRHGDKWYCTTLLSISALLIDIYDIMKLL